MVGAPGEFRMVGRMAGSRKAEEGLALGARVAVDQHRLLPALTRPAAVDSVLAAETIARIVGAWTVDLRRLAVVLPEPRPHLANELLLQFCARREQGVGIGVLSLEQRADIRRQPARVAQHLAPVLGPNPGVIVRPGQAMGRSRRPARVGARRSGQWIIVHAFSPRAAVRGKRQKAAGTSTGEAQSAAAPAARSSASPP